MESKEDMNNQVNESNNDQEEKKDNYKIIKIVVLVVSLLVICFGGYKLFIEKTETDKPKEDNTQEQENNQSKDNYSVNKFEILSINENMGEYKLINGKTLKLNVGTIEEGNYLYLDNVKIDHKVAINETLLITDKYIVGFKSLPCGVDASFAFDYNGNIINIKEDYHDLDNKDYDGQCQETGIILDNTDKKITRIENGKIVARLMYVPKNESEKVETVVFEYGANGITIQKNNIVTSNANVYNTKDGKFTLKLVQKNDPKAIEDAKNLGEDITNDAKMYAYFNDVFLVVTNIYNEDNHYATFGFSGYENAEANGYSLVINKETNTLEINPTDLVNKDGNCMKENFCGFPHHMSFIKSELGYFFIDESYGDNVLYTTSWKKLGYVYVENNKLKEVDSTGVTVYSDRNAKQCDGNECVWELLNPTKYDVNGNVINN